jgi:hypothetical protein
MSILWKTRKLICDVLNGLYGGEGGVVAVVAVLVEDAVGS